MKRPDETTADKPGARVVQTYDWRYAGGVRSVSISGNGGTALALRTDSFVDEI